MISLLTLTRNYAKYLVCDIAVVIQGESVDELPEELLLGMRLNQNDLTARRKLDE
ncbi:DUF1336 domain-containing protein [archaeon]|nr:MAG: DUF1336 domain-containing protein [archaeon]